MTDSGIWKAEIGVRNKTKDDGLGEFYYLREAQIPYNSDFPLKIAV